MQEMPIPVSPMEMIGTDFIGPFTKTDLGYKYALTIIDYHTGWAEVYPTRDQSAREIVRVFAEEFLPRHGHPRMIINDNGQGFASKAWADFLEAADIRLVRTTPVHPEGNSKVERLNRTFKELLNKSLLNAPCDWAGRIPHVLSAYRHAVSDVTGFTPFYLLYGRRERVPLPRYLAQDRPFNNRLDDLAEAYRQCATRTLESRKYNRERLNARANVDTSLNVGDSVVIKAEERITNTTRWDPHWQVYRVRGTTHWLRNQKTGQTKRLHREKLTLVDPTLVWDEIAPRPKRQFAPRPASLRVLAPPLVNNVPIQNQGGNLAANQDVVLETDMPDAEMLDLGAGQTSRTGSPRPGPSTPEAVEDPTPRAEDPAVSQPPATAGAHIRDARRGRPAKTQKRKRRSTSGHGTKWQRISFICH